MGGWYGGKKRVKCGGDGGGGGFLFRWVGGFGRTGEEGG